MKKKKILMTVMSLALVLVVAVGGTLAYLSDKTDPVTNTFNVGSGYETDDDHTGLWLDETAKPAEGNPLEPDTDDRTETGVEYEEMMPGSVVAKDPTFHLTTGCTTSYVFAYVSGVDDMIADGYYFTVEKPEALVDPAANAFDVSWEKIGDEAGFDGWYVYVVNSKAFDGEARYGVQGGTDMAPMFNYVKLGSGLDNAGFDGVAEMSQVQIFGVAVQTANLTMDQALAVAGRVVDSGVAPIEG